MPRVFDARDREALGRFANRRDHRRVKGHALHRQVVGAERGHEQPAMRMRGGIHEDDAHALAARELAEFRQHDVERAVDFVRRQQRTIHFTEHFERAPIPLQRHRRDVELALERLEFFHGHARNRLELAVAQARESTLQLAQWRQIAFADDRGDSERDDDRQHDETECRGRELTEGVAERRFGRKDHDGVGAERIAALHRRNEGHGAAPFATGGIPREDGGATRRVNGMRRAARKQLHELFGHRAAAETRAAHPVEHDEIATVESARVVFGDTE